MGIWGPFTQNTCRNHCLQIDFDFSLRPGSNGERTSKEIIVQTNGIRCKSVRQKQSIIEKINITKNLSDVLFILFGSAQSRYVRIVRTWNIMSFVLNAVGRNLPYVYRLVCAHYFSLSIWWDAKRDSKKLCVFFLLLCPIVPLFSNLCVTLR